MTTIDETGTPERFDPKQQPPAVAVKVTHLRGTVSMLEGSGGNAAVSAGADGIFLVDSFYETMWDELGKALTGLSSAPVRYVAVTHWHPDHIGNNGHLAAAGAIVVAEDRARPRAAVANYIKEVDIEMPPAEPGAWPTLTFTESISFYLNDERIDVVSATPSHSDSDSIVVFHSANVIATGDLYSYGVYPLIDTRSGGSIDGTIAQVRRILEVCDDDTLIVAGHGPFGDGQPRADRRSLSAYLDMLVTVRERVAAAVASGNDLGAVLAGRLTADLDAQWGAGMVAPDTFVTSVYDSLSNAHR